MLLIDSDRANNAGDQINAISLKYTCEIETLVWEDNLENGEMRKATG